MYLRLYLEDMGHKVTSASSMQAALELAPRSDCEVAIVDIGLPDGDGWEFLHRARFKGEVYAIAMSGFGTSADRSKSQALGFRHHLLKPFDPDELDRILAGVARQKAA